MVVDLDAGVGLVERVEVDATHLITTLGNVLNIASSRKPSG
ncbi:MAG: hypothetical protein R3B84_10735 [Zavarzinella sp.]